MLCVGLAGCSLSNQDLGVIGGGAVGGLLGNQIGGGSGNVAATIGGTLLGAYLGSRVGQSMDRTDKLYAEQALNRNNATSWDNPDTGRSYRVEPGPVYRYHHRQCRDYTMDVYMHGRRQQVHGRACKDPNGRWVNER